MMRKTFTFSLVIFTAISLFAQIPAGYYNSANGFTGYTLKDKLRAIITNGHQDKGYNGLWTAYQTTDRDYYYENNGRILDMYSENPIGPDPYQFVLNTDQCGNYSNEGDCYNREHIVPQSLFNENAPMKHDVHFIPPTDGKVNGMRSNYPFGIVASPTWTSLNGSKLGNNSTGSYSGTVFEPINEFKGDIARMIFYFVTRYQNQIPSFSTGNMLDGTTTKSLAQWELDILLLWHNADPVSQREIDRNNACYTWQGNRNPYIDHPEYVQQIWGTSALSTIEIKNSKGFSVYPNPVKNNEIFVTKNSEISKISKAEIYDVTGILVQVLDKPFKNGNKIILRDLPKGNYILKLDENSTKFILE